MHKIILYSIAGCLLVGSCSLSSQKRNFVLTENYIKLCYGIETSVDTNNFMEHAMYLVNTSDYKACLALFKNQYALLDTVWDNKYNQFGLAIPVPRTDPPYNPLTYLSYRYNDFLDDLPDEFQNNILLDGINFDHPDSLFNLQRVERFTLRYNKNFHPDTVIAKQIIVAAQSLQKKAPNSRRLDYIIATAYLKLGKDSITFPIYDRLVKENYYALPCLVNCITYLDEQKRESEKEKYIVILKKMFPNVTTPHWRKYK